MRRRSLAIISTVAVVVACGGGGSSERDETRRSDAAPAAPGNDAAWFTDATASSGLDFIHFNGMSGERYLAEIMAPGVALFDYDNDGDLDLYAVQGQMLGPKTLAQAVFPPPSGAVLADRLYRNDLQVRGDGTRALRFTDVTASSGIDVRSYGMGVATGDIDNDGWVDLYLTRLGRNVMLRNNGNGTFSDVSKTTGTDHPAWSVSASFLDYDRDGWLDLYVGNYLEYSIATDRDCFARSGTPDYCAPAVYRPAGDRLFRNRGDGRFEDTTAAARVAGELGPALGVSAADFNGDGWLDIYVANDAAPNLLWLNQRDGTFKDMGLPSGSALSGDGRAEGSMGVDAGDFDNDGDDDLFMTHLSGEGHNLYVNDGSAVFEDRSAGAGLTAATLAFTGFGAGWLDVDNDGQLDVMTVAGAIHAIEALARRGDRYPLHQRKQLLRNLGGGRFEDVTARAGAAFAHSEVGRGAAFGDVDNDGDTDAVVANNSGPLRLLLNEIGNRRHWLGVRAIDSSPSERAPLVAAAAGDGRPTARPVGGRDMLGARVAVVREDAAPMWRRVRTDGSYASANDPRVLFGLGDHADSVVVRVVWPDGHAEEWPGVAVDRWVTLVRGSGR